ncbi:MAG TPA: peroxidase-related enzyme, partial [Gaiellaceae bacterium]
LDYALKLTLRPTEMLEADVTALREAGWTDEDVMDIAEVTGMFNLTNRMASGLGWEPNPEYDALGR